jgi:hypothetical protein
MLNSIVGFRSEDAMTLKHHLSALQIFIDFFIDLLIDWAIAKAVNWLLSIMFLLHITLSDRLTVKRSLSQHELRIKIAD